MAIRINRRVSIPEEEICFAFARSGGPGGQKVNKASTRVTLLFDVNRSPSLTDADRARIRGHLATRISRDGILRVVSQRHRTQTANRRAVLERFEELMRAALKPRRRRKPTRVPEAVKERRLRDKKHRSRLKLERTRSPGSDR
jgi:ribosome-associated protein